MMCTHETAEPVTLVTGETVAMVCTRCLQRLPREWGCPDCEWFEMYSFSQPLPDVLLGQPCIQHANA